jgi:Putative SAM-dependent methyltransferase
LTIFELVKIALDELYVQGKKSHGNALDALIEKQIKTLSTSYANLTAATRQPIDYKDASTRFAYVYKYVASHGDYIVQALSHGKRKLGESLFAKSSLKVSCIGGGPGSDVIGVLKFLDEEISSESVSKLTCYLLDREQAWADTWVDLGDSLSTEVTLNVNFQPLDVTRPDSWSQQTKFFSADLFTFSYFLSEVQSLNSDGVVTDFVKRVFSEAKSGALFLYIDNGGELFNAFFDSTCELTSLETLVSCDNILMMPRFTEQKQELGEYLTKFGQQPKLRSTLSYRLLRKK